MKIRELHLTNFSSHENSSLVFDKPVSLIVGQLNAGKSSILQAIEYGLTGECGYHRKRTDNRSELVRGGAERGMEVRVVTDVGAAVRIRNGVDNVETLEWDGMTQATPSAMTAAVQAATRVSQTVLSALLNTSGFFNLEEPDQKEIIIGMIGAEVTDAKVRGAWTGEADALKCLPASPMNSLKALDNSFDYVFKRRTVAKRELDDLKPPPQPEGTRPQLDKMRARLAEVEKELQDTLVAQARLEGAASAVSGRQRLEAEAKELESLISGKAIERPDATIKAMKAQEDTAKEAATAAIAVQEEVVNLRVQLATCQSNIDLLSTFNGRCVAGDHACPAPMADMKAALRQQEAKVAAFSTQVKESEVRLQNVCKVRDDRTEYNALKKKFDAIASAINERTIQGNRLAEIRKQLENADPAVDTAEIGKLQDKAEALRFTAAKGKGIIESAVAWVNREQQVALVAEKRKKLEIEIRHLSELVTFLGSKGIRVQLIDEKINVFADEIQKHLTAFGYTMQLTVDPWTIVINGQPVKRLSASERYRLSVAFQVGIARMSGVNFVICDGSEILTPPVFGSMMGMLANAGLDQAIVIKTLMIPTETFLKARPRAPGVECFMVTNTDGVSTVERLD